MFHPHSFVKHYTTLDANVRVIAAKLDFMHMRIGKVKEEMKAVDICAHTVLCANFRNKQKVEQWRISNALVPLWKRNLLIQKKTTPKQTGEKFQTRTNETREWRMTLAESRILKEGKQFTPDNSSADKLIRLCLLRTD